MGLVLLLISGFPVLDLISDSPEGPDDYEVYEAVEESLMVSADVGLSAPIRHYLVWRLNNEAISSVPLRVEGWRSFVRANFRQARRSAWIILEKDRGERNWADFWGAGLSFCSGNLRFTFGDYIFHFGRGLIFSGPYYRSGGIFRETGSDSVHSPRSAQEGRNLRGVRGDFNFGRYSISVIGSYSLRDAIFNPDGTVARLKFSGLHCDSGAMWERERVGQLVVGNSVHWRVIPFFVVGVAFQGIRFSHRFAPLDSCRSFYGQNLGSGGIYLMAKNEFQLAEIEFARSFPGTFAISGGVKMKRDGINLAMGATMYSERFFSPAGKSYALHNRVRRTEFTGRVSYEINNFLIRLNGNTRYDYLNDSIPGRLQFGVGYRAKPFQMTALIGRSFRGESEFSRSAFVEMTVGGQYLQTQIYWGDEYLENNQGRGRMAGFNFKFSTGRADFFASGALVNVSGDNLILSVPEPGVMRLGSSYRCSKSTGRVSFTWGWRLLRGIRLGAKLGLAHQERWTADFALQIETRG